MNEETGATEATETAAESTSESSNESGETQATDGTPKSAPKESKEPKEDDEFEVVKSANREWKLPKEAAKTFKHLNKGYTQATQQAAELRKVLEQLEQDPDSVMEKVLSKKGMDLDTWAEKRLMQRLEHLNKSPEQIELEKYKKELGTYKQREEQEAKQRAEAEQKELEQYVTKQLDTEIAKAWKDSKLPADPIYIKHIGALILDSMKLANAGKIERVLTAKEAADIVKGKQRQTWKAALPTLDVMELLELIGPEKFTEMKQKELARLTNPASMAGFGQQKKGSPSSDNTQSVPTQKRTLTEKEYRALYED